MKQLRLKKQWIVWNLEEGPNGKPTKIPYTIRGAKASSTDPTTWSTYEQAKIASQYFSGIGIVFPADQKLLGIDIDHVIENGKIIGENKKQIEQFIEEASTYTEFSPSGTGLHLYLSVEESLPLFVHKNAPWELYADKRFFTVTEDSYHKKPKPIRVVSKAEAERLIALTGYPWGNSDEVLEAPAELIGEDLFTDDELLERMFASKNGDKIQALYNGDLSEYKNDASRADSSFLMHVAFWSQKHASQMERVWLASPLGAREKTQKRQDYRTRSITNAIRKCKDTYSVPIESTIDFLYTTTAKGDKTLTKNTENVCRALRHHPDFSNSIRFDEFKNRIEMKQNDLWRPIVDSDSIDVQTRLSIVFSFLRTVSKDMCMDAMVKIAKENSFDSAKEFIKNIKWDGEARLDEWLHHTYGAPIDAYHIAVASNWMKGLVKRIMLPGCKFDYVLVLEGPQGAKKSTSLDIIGHISERENWHVETTMSTDSKDFFMQFEGKVIIEFSEGETLSRTEVKKMKSIITTAVDRYRASYGRTAEDFPRHCVFAMTTNQDEYLKDETGNRRWLPVKVELPQANIDWLKENRDQLFAEAYVRVMEKNETTYEFPFEETMAQQNQRRISDPNEDKIVEWYMNDPFLQDKEDGITVAQVYAGALAGFGALKKYDEMSIADVLARVLKLEKRRKMVNGVQSMRWFAPEPILSPLQEEMMMVDGEEEESAWK